MNSFIVTNNEEFNTSEGYFGNANYDSDVITIPYVHMGLLPKHPLNRMSYQRFINFAYLQIINLGYISVFDKGWLLNHLENYNTSKSKYFGGLFVGDRNEIDNEFEVQVDTFILIIPSNFKISKEIWIPEIKGFNEKATIDNNSINTFFNTTKSIKKGVWCR